MRRQFLSLILLLPLCLAACGGGDDNGNPTQPSTPSPQGPAELQLTTLTEGTGEEATGSMFVVAHYTLWFYDPAGADSKGSRRESSRDAGSPGPISFRLGANAVIPGFEQIIRGMRVGGSRRGIVPPSLAYGSTGYQSIPPNTWLVFEIELLAVTP